MYTTCMLCAGSGTQVVDNTSQNNGNSGKSFEHALNQHSLLEAGAVLYVAEHVPALE